MEEAAGREAGGRPIDSVSFGGHLELVPNEALGYALLRHLEAMYECGQGRGDRLPLSHLRIIKAALARATVPPLGIADGWPPLEALLAEAKERRYQLLLSKMNETLP